MTTIFTTIERKKQEKAPLYAVKTYYSDKKENSFDIFSTKFSTKPK